MSKLNSGAVLAGSLLALALTLVGVLVGFPAVGLFGGIAAGSYVAVRRAGSQGWIQGAGVAVLMLVGGVALLFLERGTMPSIDSVNATSLMWAAAAAVPRHALAVRRPPTHRAVLVGAVAFAVFISKTRSGLPGLEMTTPVLGWVLQLGSLALIAFLVGFVVKRRGWLAASEAYVGGVVLFVLVDLRPTPPWAFISSVIGWGPADAKGSWEAVIGMLGIGVPWTALSGAAGSWAPRARSAGGSHRWSTPMNGSVRRLLLMGVGVIVIAALVVLGWRFNGLGIRTASPLASVAVAFDSPPAYPGYEWTRDGKTVPREEIAAIAGPDHCSWQSATFLFIGWPPGTFASTAALARQYVRDPQGAINSSLRQRLTMNIAPPPDARPTGYRLGSIEIYISPSDQDEAIYVVGPRGAERWPRSDPMTLCA